MRNGKILANYRLQQRIANEVILKFINLTRSFVNKKINANYYETRFLSLRRKYLNAPHSYPIYKILEELLFYDVEDYERNVSLRELNNEDPNEKIKWLDEKGLYRNTKQKFKIFIKTFANQKNIGTFLNVKFLSFHNVKTPGIEYDLHIVQFENGTKLILEDYYRALKKSLIGKSAQIKVYVTTPTIRKSKTKESKIEFDKNALQKEFSHLRNKFYGKITDKYKDISTLDIIIVDCGICSIFVFFNQDPMIATDKYPTLPLLKVGDYVEVLGGATELHEITKLLE